MKEFLLKKKKIIINIIILFVILITMSIMSALILSAFGIITFDGGINFNTHIFDSFRDSWYGWIIFILFQTILTILLCAIPGASMAFIVLCTNLYPEPWQAFIISFVSVLISSAFMYLLGRNGGYKLCVKMLGEEDCDKSLTLFRNKGTVYFPLMMLFPIFPDDALVMIAGTLKMKMRWFLPSIFIGRGIGIAAIVFGFAIIPFEEFTSLYDWIIFITICVFWVGMLFKAAHKFNEKTNKRKQK